MKRVIFATLFLLVFVTDASAMRCSRKLIQVGDYVQRMYINCGKPVFSINLSTAFVNKQQHTYEQNGRTKVITVVDGKITSINTTR